jgi:hypothetical protein
MRLEILQPTATERATPFAGVQRFMASRRNSDRAIQIGILVVLAVGAILMILPFAILWALVRLLPPWTDEKTEAPPAA